MTIEDIIKARTDIEHESQLARVIEAKDMQLELMSAVLNDIAENTHQPMNLKIAKARCALGRSWEEFLS